MVSKNDIFVALNDLYHRLGTQNALAKRAGITQSTIHAYLNGKAQIENMPVGVFIRLFNEMTIDFSGDLSSTQREDLLRQQLLMIFDTLTTSEKIACITYVAKNFGNKLPEPKP